MEDIDNLTGGVFSGYQTRPVYIHDSKQNITIGLYANVGKFPELLKIILQNIREDLYKALAGKITELRNKKWSFEEKAHLFDGLSIIYNYFL